MTMEAHTLNVNRECVALRVLRSLDRRREEGDYDFTIIVQGRKIHAERNVLISASDYFKAMLNTEMTEAGSGEVTMQDVDFDCVNTCINFIYGREVSVLAENFEKLMYVANMLQLKELCDAIEAKIGETLEISQFFVILNIANLYNRTILMRECTNFAIVNFVELSKEEDFNSMGKAFLKELVTSERVVASEEEKFNIIMNWVKHDEQRQEELIELIKCIDFSRVSIQFGRNTIANELLINQNNQCLVHISLEILASVPERGVSAQSHNDDRRLPDPLPQLRSVPTPEQEAERNRIEQQERLRDASLHQRRSFPLQPLEESQLNAAPVDLLRFFHPVGHHWWPGDNDICPMSSSQFMPPQ